MPGNFDANYGFEPQRGYNFTRYASDLSGISIYYGLGAHSTNGDSNIKVKFTVEYPNMFFLKMPSIDVDLELENFKYDKIFTICPYTASYANERFGTTKFISTWFPLPDEPLASISDERPYDVFYSGHNIVGFEIINMIFDVVSKYMGQTFHDLNAKIAAQSYNSFIAKMEIYSKTKICVVHNLLSTKVPNLENAVGDELCKKHMPWVYDGSSAFPQMKSRIFEGAKMGCILLAYKDSFGTIEHYFKEGDEFLYFADAADLEAKIRMISQNYDKYKHIGLAAQKRYNENYTLSHFVKNISSLCHQTNNI
jgi:hypothetical protein